MQTTMQFKDFIWPHNPSTFTSQLKQQTVLLKHPGGGYTLQDLGAGGRTFEGNGEFYGSNAYNDFRRLAKVFCEGGAGMLYHPSWGGCTAYFTALQLLQEPLDNYVSYAFTFQALPPTSAELAPRSVDMTVMVQPGQTLDGICNTYGVSVEQTLERNPQIANPAMVQDGTKVVIQCKVKY